MRKFLTTLLSLALLISLSACSNDTEKKADENKEIPKKENTKEKEDDEVKYTDELIKIKVEGGELAGTLTTPVKTTSKSLPVVLLVPGSGPVPKNGTANEFAELSIELANKGIASLRYDKRGSFDSNGIQIEEDKIRVNDYVNDICQLIMHLQDNKKFTDVFVLGHSQGALFSALAIDKTPVDGFISVAGAGRSMDILLKEQIKENELNPPEVINEANVVINKLKNGERVEDVSKIVEQLFRPSIQNYLIDWFSYNPVDAYKKISNIPIIIIQGKNDIQVKEKDAKLLADVLENNEAILIDKMSHVLKDAATKEDRKEHIKIYNNVKAPLNDEFLNVVITFINENKKDISKIKEETDNETQEDVDTE